MKTQDRQEPNEVVSEKEVILLGLIAEEPIHAYGLEDKIRTRRMTEWTEIAFSSIYRLLARLEARGLIESRLEHGGPGATRKVHEITPSGREALAAGVLGHLGTLRPVKSLFQVGLAFMTSAPYQQVISTLEIRAAGLKAVENEVVDLGSHHGCTPGPCQNDPGRSAGASSPLAVRLLLTHVLEHVRTEIDLVDNALATLRREGDSGFPSGPTPGAKTREQIDGGA